jgi:hypothetical protein
MLAAFSVTGGKLQELLWLFSQAWMAERVAQAVNYQNFFGCLAMHGWLSGWYRRSTTRTSLVV